jgi:hypothetical protein
MPELRVGQLKTFGTEGPMYEITGNGHPAKDGEWFVPIRVIETGEEMEYPYSQLKLDPEAR